jgi:tetratricopeptide (TPR) repeat protein
MTKKETFEAEKLKRQILSESIKLEKVHKIWLSEYYLGLAYLINGDLKKAKIYAKKGLAMNPNQLYLWNLLHSSQKTGKSVVDFLPSKKRL